MKKLYLIFLLFLFLFGCATSNIYINPEIGKENIKRIAVMPLDSIEEGGNAGRFMSQLITTYLLALDGIQVISEEEVQKALKETDSHLEAGRKMDVDAILSGSIGEYGYRPGVDYYREKETKSEKKTTIKEGNPTKEEEKLKETTTSKKSQPPTIALTVKLTSVQSGQTLWAYNLTTNYFGGDTLGEAAAYTAKRIANRLLKDLKPPDRRQ